jgi:site-specific DNA-methyltransferase (adenine-specific)
VDKKAALFTSKSDEYSTPDDLFQGLNRNFNFSLDTASTKENAKCKKYFVKGDNALSRSWKGERTFTNPPYSAIKDWVKKNYEESKLDPGNPKVMLIPARCDTKYWHDYVMRAASIYFIKGRLKFSNSKNSAPFPSAIVVFHGFQEGKRNVQGCDRKFQRFW